MIKYEGKVFRNIQEQVAKNMEDIAILKQYEGYMGPYATTSAIPEEDLTQDWLYLIGNVAPYELYKYNADGTFTDLGLFPLAGPQGDVGPQGVGIVSITKTGTSGLVDTYTITLSNGQTSTFTVRNGATGDRGVSIVSITKTGTSGLVDTYTITLSNGQTSTFTVTNGAEGVGITSVTKTGTSGLVDTYTITLSNGQTSTFTVTNGEKGDRGPEGQKQIYHHAIYVNRNDGNTFARFFFDCYNYSPTEINSIVDLCAAYENPPSGTKILASHYTCSGYYDDSNNNQATIISLYIQGSYIRFDTGVHLVAGMAATVTIPVDDTYTQVVDHVTPIHNILD